MKADISLRALRCGVVALCLVSGSASAQAVKPAVPQFVPGAVWNDMNGAPIDAHGGGILFHNGVYYWYGEIKQGKTWTPESNRSGGGTRVEMKGVSCCASRDLLHWKNM